LDNISQLVRANYSSPKALDELMVFAYDLAAQFGCAVVFAAHPRKRSQKVRLADDADAFFEQVMGSSHGINSTGSLWGLERDGETSVFVGGRQRANGQSQVDYLQVGNDGNFAVVSNHTVNLQALLSTDARRAAWELLPDTFTYAEAQRLIVPNEMRSTSTFHDFFSQGQRLGLILDGTDGQWQKLNPRDHHRADRGNRGCERIAAAVTEVPNRGRPSPFALGLFLGRSCRQTSLLRRGKLATGRMSVNRVRLAPRSCWATVERVE